MRVSRILKLLFVTGATFLCTESFAQPPAPILLAPGSTTTGYPDASNTGYLPTGVTLHACSSVTSNNTYDSCLFSNGLDLSAGQTNVTVTRSLINGVVTGNESCQNLTMTDTEINGNGATNAATNALQCFTWKRINCHSVGQCFYAGTMDVEDSYCHDLNSTPSGHNECVLGSSQGQKTMIHNNFVSNWLNRNGGGMSSVVSFYADNGFWGPGGNLLFKNNRMDPSGSGAVYCLYAFGQPTNTYFQNVLIENNVWAKAGCSPPNNGPVIYWRTGQPTNVWSNNAYDDGTPIPDQNY